MMFRNEMVIPTLYGIKEHDMEYYLIFALVVIPFQIFADTFVHASIELFHGWKIREYLLYAKYRFRQRQISWKGAEDTLDECIAESKRTLDQHCFSSQFYFMTTIYVSGLIYFVLGTEMMIRSQYNAFGDTALPSLVLFVVFCSIILKKILVSLALSLGLWRTRREKISRDNAIITKGNEMEDFKIESHDTYEMNKRITSESFRYKFLNHNRSWIIGQLPNILTPRTLRKSRPHIMNQLGKVLNSLNKDISSDSDDDITPEFSSIIMSYNTTKMIKSWLSQARRRMDLKEAVKPMIQRAKNNYCEQCLSRANLHIEPIVKIEEM